MEDEFML